MLGNTTVIQYKPPFRINQTKKLAFSSQEDLLEIKGVKIPKENFDGKELKSLKGIKLPRELPLEAGLLELSAVKDGLCDKGYNIKMNQNNSFHAVNNFIYEVHKIPLLKNRNLVNVLGRGENSIKIDIGKNPKTKEDEVLKLSLFPNYPKALGRDVENFDLPIIDAGSKKPGGEDKVHWCIQPKAKTEGIKFEHVQEMRRKIERFDYNAAQISKNQLGFYKGKLFLLDPECAKVKKENRIPCKFYF